MYLKVCCIVVLFFGVVQNIDALPRDKTVVNTEILTAPDHVQLKQGDAYLQERHIPGRLWCQNHDSEAVEDETCQGHCIPKGYSYGLCVSNTCSCV